MKDVFEIIKSQKQHTPNSFLEPFGKEVLVYDVEVYKNFLYMCFLDSQGKYYEFERYEDISGKVLTNNIPDFLEFMDTVCNTRPIVFAGYNNLNYDDCILKLVYELQYGNTNGERGESRLTCGYLWQCSQHLITPIEELDPEFREKVKKLKYKIRLRSGLNQSIDLFHQFFNKKNTRKSLKEMGIYLGFRVVQDLPYNPEETVTREEADNLKIYCKYQDINVTSALFNEFETKLVQLETMNQTIDERYAEILEISPEYETVYKPCMTGRSEVQASLLWTIFEYEIATGYNSYKIKKQIKPPKDISISSIAPQLKFKTNVLQSFYDNFLQGIIYLKYEVKKYNGRTIDQIKDMYQSKKINKNEMYDMIREVEIEKDNLREEMIRGYQDSTTLKYLPYDTKCCSKLLRAYGVTLQFGVGGLHSVDPPAVLKSDANTLLIGLDYGSYYPSMIKNLGIKPQHMSSYFNKIYSESITKRFEFKKKYQDTNDEKYKILSDMYKLQLNSLFGNLLFSGSPVFCPIAGYSVTISGQLIILQFIEYLCEEGFELISVNTDGIVIRAKRNDIPKLRNLCKIYEKDHGYTIDEEPYEKIYRHSVNDYIAVLTNGVVKTKGSFQYKTDLTKKNDSLIVQQAVKEYVRSGVGIIEHIMLNRSDPRLFMFSTKSNRQHKLFVSSDGGKTREYLQKNVRFYKSKKKNAQTLYRERICNQGLSRANIGDITQIPNGDNISVCNVLDTPPTDIDLDFYFNAAKKMLETCNFQQKYDAMEARVEGFRMLGFHPTPKNGKTDVSGISKYPLGFKHSWRKSESSMYETVGFQVGEEAKIVCLDFDKQDKTASKQFFDLVMKYPTFTTFTKGKPNLETESFKVFYRLEDVSRMRSHTPKFKETFELEVLFKDMRIAAYGRKDSNSFYDVCNEKLEILPKELEDLIVSNLPKKRVRQVFVAGSEPVVNEITPEGKLDRNEESIAVIDLQKESELMTKIIQQVLPDWQHTIKKGEKNGTPYKKYSGHCPYNDIHTSGTTNGEFDICIREGDEIPLIDCFHNSCKGEIHKLRKVINGKWLFTRNPVTKVSNVVETHLETTPVLKTTVEPVEEKPVEFEITDTNTDTDLELEKAFLESSESLIVTASTGTGKTYSSAKLILQRLKKKQSTVYVASNKLEMVQMKQLLQKLSGKNVEDLKIGFLESRERLEGLSGDEDDIDGSKKISKDVQALVTHHTYFLRKGRLSNLYYSVLRWISVRGDVTVIIDEIDSYIEKSTYSFEVGSRYQLKKRRGFQEKEYRKLSVCPKFQGTGSCKTCFYGNHQFVDNNAFSLPEVRTKSKVLESEYNQRKRIPLPNFTFVGSRSVPTKGRNNTEEYITEYKQIENHENYIETKDYKFFLEKGETYNVVETFQDLAECAYFPNSRKEFASYEGEKITKDEILALSDEERKKVNYPYFVCDTPILTFKDTSVIKYITSNSERQLYLTATLSEEDREFLKSCNPDLKTLDVSRESEIEEVLLVGTPEPINLANAKDHYLLGFDEFGMVLIFQPTANRANTLFSNLPKDFPVCLYRENSVLRQDKFTNKDTKYIITHSRGALGRGFSLEEVHTTIVNSLIVKPNHCFEFDKMEDKEIVDKKDGQRKKIIEQNIGRMLRGKGKKVCILYNSYSDDLEYLKPRIENLVKNVSTIYLHNVHEVKIEALDFLKGRKIVERQDEEKSIGTTVTQVINAVFVKYPDGLYPKWTSVRRSINFDRFLIGFNSVDKKTITNKVRDFLSENKEVKQKS